MQITVNGDSCFIEDLGSSNGTFINGKLIKKATIKNEDKIANFLKSGKILLGLFFQQIL